MRSRAVTSHRLYTSAYLTGWTNAGHIWLNVAVKSGYDQAILSTIILDTHNVAEHVSDLRQGTKYVVRSTPEHMIFVAGIYHTPSKMDLGALDEMIKE